MTLSKWVAATATAMTTVLVAGSAMALSCMRPSIEQSFQGWSEASETYYIVSGTLTPAAPLPPVPSISAANRGNFDTSNLRGVYRVQGEVIGPVTSDPIDHYVWVRVGCAGPWCGQFPVAGTSGVMAFKQLPDRTLELRSGACPGSIFADGDGSVKARVQQCMTGNCVPPTPFR